MRLSHLAFVLPLALLAGLLPTGFAEPRASWDLAARVPASTLAVLTVEEIHRLEERANGTAIGKLLRDPAMKDFVDPLKKAFDEVAGAPTLPPEVQELTKVFGDLRGQLAVALVGVHPESGPQLVASIDFGSKVGEFGTFLQKLAEQLGDELSVTSETKDGRTWWTVVVPRGPTLTATTVDTVFVAATDRALLTNVVATPAPTGGTLAASPDYQAVLGRVGREGLTVFLYGNVPAALRAFEEPLRRAGPVPNALGLDTVKAVAYGMSFAGDGFRDTLLLHAPGADHGLVPLLRLAPIDRPRLLGLAPANAFALEEGNLNLDTLLPSLRTLVAGIDADAAGELEQGLKKAQQVLGVDVEKELLAGLAGTWGYYASLPQGGGLFPEVVLMLTVKDPAAFEGVATRLCEGIAGAVNEEGRVIVRTRVMEYEGQRLHLVELQRARGDDVVPFTPSWTLLGDRLLVTLVPYTLKEVVWRAKHAAEAGPGLDAQEDFRALWGLRPASAGAFSYLDLQAVLSLLYDTGVPLLQTVAKPNVMGDVGAKLPLDWAALPPARAVRPYFRSTMSFLSWGPDGIEARLHSPIPFLPIVFVAATAGAMFAANMRAVREPTFVPEVMEAPPVPEPVAPEDDAGRARRELDDLRRYVRLFVLEKDRLPAGLDDLVAEQFLETLSADPWGNAYRLVVVDAKEKSFRVVSDGPDGKPGTPDDVAVSSAGER